MEIAWSGPLEDALSALIDHRGKTPKKLGGDWSDEGVPVYSAAHIKDGRLQAENARRVSWDMYERWMPVKLQAGDVLLTSEAPLGEVAYLASSEPACVGQRLFALRPRSDILDSRFLYYWLQQSTAQSQLLGRATGTTVSGIRQAELVKVHLDLPPLETQRKIAAVLAAYDELIENNLRRIEILEEMAQAVYREWFVNFRYPGHENIPLVDSPLGPVPGGWTATTIGDATPFQLSKPRVSTFEGQRRYLATADCRGFHDLDAGVYLKHTDLPSRAQHVPVPNSVWFGRMANYRKVMVFYEASPEMSELVLSSGFACLDCEDDAWTTYVASWVLTEEFEDLKARYATGATQVSLTDRGARQMPVLLPPSDLVERFGELVTPMYRLALLLRRQNANLRSTRDLLLPKLVSGEIDVSDLDIDTDWLVA